MAVCAHCKAEETELYINSIPICMECEKKRSASEPPSPRKAEQPQRPDAGQEIR
jgi:hypothetical protein